MAQGPHCVKSMPIKQVRIVLRKNSLRQELFLPKIPIRKPGVYWEFLRLPLLALKGMYPFLPLIGGSLMGHSQSEKKTTAAHHYFLTYLEVSKGPASASFFPKQHSLFSVAPPRRRWRTCA